MTLPALDALLPEEKQRLRELVRSETFLLFLRTCVSSRVTTARRYIEVVTNPRDTDMHLKGFIKACAEIIKDCSEIANIPQERLHKESSPVEEFLQLLDSPQLQEDAPAPKKAEQDIDVHSRNAFPA